MVLQMTNRVGKALFARAGELGVPVGFMCMKVCMHAAFDYIYYLYSHVMHTLLDAIP